LEYRFFHPAIIRGLMSQIGQQAGDRAVYWKYGLWLLDGKRDAQLRVRFEDTSTDDAPGARGLELKVPGPGTLGLSRETRRALLLQHIEKKPEELLTLEGTTVARSALANVLEDGRVVDVRRKLVSAADFLAFFEDRERGPAENREAGEAPKLAI